MMEIERNNIHFEKFLETKEKHNERMILLKLIKDCAYQGEFVRLINVINVYFPNVRNTFLIFLVNKFISKNSFLYL